ncbi:GGDEF domain-containing protein [Actinophytocola sp.]|uniref:GGDEF domain-containing protein n=1 Tax=Actinophytocola sp. TaxID=1872138 RepID=UPI0025C0A408|nr:GGDEF domain-containing protein [Actinophytocola sp.]
MTITDGHTVNEPAYSHGAGDAVLVAAGATLRDHIRRSRDLICRWGGEEFVILLTSTSPEDALAIMDRMRLEVGKLVVSYLAAAGGKTKTVDAITISVGIAIAPHAGTDLDTLYTDADEALYAAKEGGRNQVRMAPRRIHSSATSPPGGPTSQGQDDGPDDTSESVGVPASA